ncbi:hypothetical protein, partial [Mailhella massiliensis]
FFLTIFSQKARFLVMEPGLASGNTFFEHFSMLVKRARRSASSINKSCSSSCYTLLAPKIQKTPAPASAFLALSHQKTEVF